MIVTNHQIRKEEIANFNFIKKNRFSLLRKTIIVLYNIQHILWENVSLQRRTRKVMKTWTGNFPKVDRCSREIKSPRAIDTEIRPMKKPYDGTLEISSHILQGL